MGTGARRRAITAGEAQQEPPINTLAHARHLLRPLGWACLALCVACAPPTVPPAIEGQLTVRAARSGVVRVGLRAAPVDPLTPASLFGVGPGPRYSIRFDHAGGVLWVPDAAGDTVDLGPLLPGPPVVLGSRTWVRLPVTTRPGRTLEVVAISDDQVVRGTVQGGFADIEVPGPGPVTFLGLWRANGKAEALGRLSLAQVVPAPGGVRLRPTHPLTGAVLVDVADARAAWVTAELTLEGVRTGLMLGAGLAGEPGVADARAAVRLPRPVEPIADRSGIWVVAQVRRVGQTEPQAEVSEHLAPLAESATLRVPAAPLVTPTPSLTPAGAAYLGRDAPRVGWHTDAPPTAVVAELTGTDGCDSRAWAVAADGRLTQQAVPEASDRDPLAAPLVGARVAAWWIEGVDFDGLLTPGVADAALLPRRVTRTARRSVSGWWRGAAASCAADPRQGEYAVRRADGACPAGREAGRVVVDRCGAVVPLTAGAWTPPLCGRLSADQFVPRGGGAGVPVASQADGSVRLETPEGPLVLAPVGAVGLRTPALLAGDWYTVTVEEAEIATAPDGSRTVGDEITLLRGGAAEGPWVAFGDSGRVQVATGAVQWSGRLLSFDGSRGEVEDEGAGCEGEARTWALDVTPAGTLTLTAEIPAAAGARRVRVIAGRR